MKEERKRDPTVHGEGQDSTDVGERTCGEGQDSTDVGERTCGTPEAKGGSHDKMPFSKEKKHTPAIKACAPQKP